MDLSRRRLLRTGAATATAAGVTLAAGAAAHAAEPDADPAQAQRQEPLRGRETAFDLEQKQANPANLLGCPLGKGE